MTDVLDRLFAVASGGGDDATRKELLLSGTEARRLAEEVGRLNATEIDLRRIAGLESAVDDDPRPAPPFPHRDPRQGEWGSPRRKALVAAVLVLLVGGGFTALAASHYQTRAAYADLQLRLDRASAELDDARKGRLADAFDTGWLDPRKWRTGRRKTTALDGYARLNDRGSLVTVQEYPAPVEVTLEWRWIDIAGDIAYRDTLTVALHTSGEHAERHPFRVRDGIEVALQAHGGQVALGSPTDGDLKAQTPEGALPMPAGEWHRVRVVDDGKAVAVYLTGPKIDKRHDGKPVLTAPYKGAFAKHHIAIYNRELVAGALHESHIRNVAISPLPGAKAE